MDENEKIWLAIERLEIVGDIGVALATIFNKHRFQMDSADCDAEQELVEGIIERHVASGMLTMDSTRDTAADIVDQVAALYKQRRGIVFPRDATDAFMERVQDALAKGVPRMFQYIRKQK
nr:hypothetical protein [Candidatus Sigynarchaeota archaeon]